MGWLLIAGLLCMSTARSPVPLRAASSALASFAVAGLFVSTLPFDALWTGLALVFASVVLGANKVG